VPFSDAEVQQVWEKGKPSSKPDEWRFDDCGAWIGRNLYGNRGSPFGWEIDHIKPIIAGGTDALSNLRPLQWENNAEKQSGLLTCPVIAEGTENVRKQPKKN
jgi:hypothetical protein